MYKRQVTGILEMIGFFLVKAGGALIDNMAILFVIGVGVGMADDNDGTEMCIRDRVQDVKPGGVFMINCQWSDEELAHHLNADAKKYIADNNIQLYTCLLYTSRCV